MSFDLIFELFSDYCSIYYGLSNVLGEMSNLFMFHFWKIEKSANFQFFDKQK